MFFYRFYWKSIIWYIIFSFLPLLLNTNKLNSLVWFITSLWLLIFIICLLLNFNNFLGFCWSIFLTFIIKLSIEFVFIRSAYKFLNVLFSPTHNTVCKLYYVTIVQTDYVSVCIFFWKYFETKILIVSGAEHHSEKRISICYSNMKKCRVACIISHLLEALYSLLPLSII